MKIKNVIFDFDGTIADILPHAYEIVCKTLKKFNKPVVTREEFEESRNKHIFDIVRQFKIMPWEVPSFLHYAKGIEKKNINNIKVVYGMRTLIHNLVKNNFRIGILTSNNESFVRSFIKINDIDVFDFVKSETNIFGKGNAIKQTLKQLQLNTDESIYIGDEVRDIQAARHAGVRIISVTWGLNGVRILEETQPDFIVDKPTEILQCLNKYF